jgi:hypothetical protein
MAECVAGLGTVASADGRLNEAAQLLGAAEAALKARGASVRASNRGDYDRNLTAVRAKLSEAAFAKAWAAGRMMTLEEATSLALREMPTA